MYWLVLIRGRKEGWEAGKEEGEMDVSLSVIAGMRCPSSTYSLDPNNK